MPRKLRWGCSYQGIHPGSHGADLKGWHQTEHVCREEDGNKAFCGWESGVWGRRTSPESSDDSLTGSLVVLRSGWCQSILLLFPTSFPGLQTSHCWQNPPLHCRNLGDSLEGRKILFGLVHPTQGRHLSFCGLRASVPAVLLTSLKHTSSGKSHLITASWVRQKLCYECPEHPLGAAVNLLVSASLFSKGWHWACGVTYIQVFSIVPSAQKVSAPNEIA